MATNSDLKVNWVPQCVNCLFLDRRKSQNQATPLPYTCIAFPAGIPDLIIRNKFDHKNPYPGDNGIQFEPVDGE